MVLNFTPLEFETSCGRRYDLDIAKLNFTPLEFETSKFKDKDMKFLC